MPSKKKPSAKQPDLESLVRSNEVFSLSHSLENYNRLIAGLRPQKGWWSKVFLWFHDRRQLASTPLKLRDYELKWRIHARKHYGWAFLVILLVQNGFVLWLVYSAYVDDRLKDLSLILSVLISGTLTETYFIFRIIVTELFKEIRFSDYIDRKEGK